jgi:type IV pilus assembly protein PilB
MDIEGSAKKDDLKKQAALLGMPFIDKCPKEILSDAVRTIRPDVVNRYNIVPFEIKDAVLNVAMLDPQDMNALNALRFIGENSGLGIVTYLTSEDVFREMLHLYESDFSVMNDAAKSMEEENAVAEELKVDDSDQVVSDAPIAKLVEVIISHAIDGRASDIHIEPSDGDFRVRYRVDGSLHVGLVLPRAVGPAVVSRIKILSNLKIDEKRKPQDGRFRLNENGKQIDFRVSTLPVIAGEKLVMRVLDNESGVGDMRSAGIIGTAEKNIQLAIEESYGMILMTGPTGSGKSTTLYSLLKILNKEEKNIITLEDPIEYNIYGLNQSQIKPEIGYTFASGLRTILRQDPNIIMVGEIRDAETAELSVHAALTGHLMLSTLHTNTAIGAIPRLIDMGIEPFLLASALRMVMAQRLVKKICEYCKKEREVSKSVKDSIMKEIENIPKEEIKKYGLDLSKGAKFYQGAGCDECNGTGLRGRIAIFEAIPITDAMRSIIIDKHGSEILIKAESDRIGNLTIKQDGVLKILKGETIIEEVERVTEGRFSLDDDIVTDKIENDKNLI